MRLPPRASRINLHTLSDSYYSSQVCIYLDTIIYLDTSILAFSWVDSDIPSPQTNSESYQEH
jgi:hypothetical protein